MISNLKCCAEAERRRKEEAERKAKLDEIAEKQRQRERELEEKEKLRREALLGRSTAAAEIPSTHLVEPAPAALSAPAAAAAAPAPTAARYVPKFRRQNAEGPGQAPPPEPDRWGSSRQDDRPSQAPSDRWRNDDRRPAFGGSRSSWSSSRNPPRGSER